MVEALTEDTDVDNFLFASHSHDPVRNPISYDKKITFLETLFPSANVMNEADVRNPYDAVKFLENQGYTNITMFAGDDRAQTFKEGIGAYINHPEPDKGYMIETFDVVNVGSRVDEADEIALMSATDARTAGLEGDMNAFARFIPTEEFDIVESIYYAIKEGMSMSINEEMRSILNQL